jgi:hypothetical protein
MPAEIILPDLSTENDGDADEKNLFQRMGLKAAEALGFDKEEFMNRVRVGDVITVMTMLNDPRAVIMGGVDREFAYICVHICNARMHVTCTCWYTYTLGVMPSPC